MYSNMCIDETIDTETKIKPTPVITAMSYVMFMITFILSILGALMTIMGAFFDWSFTGFIATCSINLIAVTLAMAIISALSDIQELYEVRGVYWLPNPNAVYNIPDENKVIVNWIFSFGWISSSIGLLGVIALVSGTVLKLVDLPAAGNVLLIAGAGLFVIFTILAIFFIIRSYAEYKREQKEKVISQHLKK